MSGIWIDHYIKKIQDDYLWLFTKYLKILSKEITDHDKNPELFRIFKACGNCRHTNQSCLDPFKSILSIFKREIVLNDDIRTMNTIFEHQLNPIIELLKVLAIKDEENNIIGYPHIMTDKDDVSAYNSIAILKFLIEFQDYPPFEDLFNLENNIKEYIENLQHDTDKMVKRKFVGDKINILGCWDEYLWGELVYRMKSTSNIASILCGFENCNKEVIRRTKRFFINAFHDKLYILDLVDTRDNNLSLIKERA